MELNREHFRAIIFYNFRRGLNQQQCIDKLNSIFGNEAPLMASVYWWYGEFNRDRSSLQYEFREGNPKSVVVPETIDAVCQLILQDCHVTYCEIGKTDSSLYSETQLLQKSFDGMLNLSADLSKRQWRARSAIFR